MVDTPGDDEGIAELRCLECFRRHPHERPPVIGALVMPGRWENLGELDAGDPGDLVDPPPGVPPGWRLAAVIGHTGQRDLVLSLARAWRSARSQHGPGAAEEPLGPELAALVRSAVLAELPAARDGTALARFVVTDSCLAGELDGDRLSRDEVERIVCEWALELLGPSVPPAMRSMAAGRRLGRGSTGPDAVRRRAGRWSIRCRRCGAAPWFSIRQATSMAAEALVAGRDRPVLYVSADGHLAASADLVAAA